jgi:hypothetical protein
MEFALPQGGLVDEATDATICKLSGHSRTMLMCVEDLYLEANETASCGGPGSVW